MPDEKKAKLSLTRPADKSLEAYRRWVMAIMKNVKPDATDTKTDEEWAESHRKFWEKAEKAE